MKAKFWFITFLMFVSTNVFSQTSGEQEQYKNGWLVYMHDDNVIFVETKSKIKNAKSFFRDSTYENGIFVSGLKSVDSLQRKAKTFHVYQKINKKVKIKIGILSVNVKIILRSDYTLSNLEHISFHKGEKMILLSFRVIDHYKISDITLL